MRRMWAATNGQGTKNAAATTRPAPMSASTGTGGPGRSGSGACAPCSARSGTPLTPSSPWTW